MTDDLVKRWDDYVESMGSVMGDVEHMAQQMRNRIEQLTAQLESTLRDRKLILEERDRTFALMLARAEKAEADNERLREVLETIGKTGPADGLLTHSGRQIVAIINDALNTGKEPSHE